MLAVISHRLVGFNDYFYLLINNTKRGRFLSHQEAVGIAQIADKSRPRKTQTFTDLFWLFFRNFLHFLMPNKSQTRKFNMYSATLCALVDRSSLTDRLFMWSIADSKGRGDELIPRLFFIYKLNDTIDTYRFAGLWVNEDVGGVHVFKVQTIADIVYSRPISIVMEAF